LILDLSATNPVAPTLQEILSAINNINEAILVYRREIAGVELSIAKRDCRFRGFTPVAQGDTFAFSHNFADLCRLHQPAGLVHHAELDARNSFPH